jgi:4-hydroxy-tetrahydrodipicolinate reductase
LLIDFSTPAAVMAIIDDVERYARALVIGTTGFTDSEMERIAFASESLPLLLSANFAESFEPFVSACREVAAAYPEYLPELSETYHLRKKNTPSGTSLRLQREVAASRAAAGADSNQAIPIEVRREGDVVGRHLFRVEVGASALEIGFEVSSLESFARGALQAGHWVAEQGPGFYSMADYIRSRQGKTSNSIMAERGNYESQV